MKQRGGFNTVTLLELCRDIVSIPNDWGDIQIKALASDSRKVMPGTLFVAIKGYETDGHRFIDQAIENGAVALVVEENVDDCAIPMIKVDNSRKVLSLMANRFFESPSEQLDFVGITGTNGKTTTAVLLQSVFEKAGKSPGLIGTINYEWKNHSEEANNTTPDILQLHEILAKMKNDQVQSVVMEVSSHALALHRVEGLKFKVGIFTNLTRDHMDFHKTTEAYADAKARLFQMISEDGVAILNGDDPFFERMKKEAKCKVLTFGIKNPHVDCPIKEIKMHAHHTTFEIEYAGRKIPVSTHLLGRYNVLNVAAAILTGLEMGVEEDTIRYSIADVHNVPGRVEHIKTSAGFRVLVDYAHTPDALQNVLISAREFTQNKLIAVFGCGGDRDRGKRPEMGRIGSVFSDVCIITSDNPRTENPTLIIDDIIAGVEPHILYEAIPDRREAIYHALKIARHGDTVVIAGKGHETYQQVGHEKFPFDDREVARECLKKLNRD